MKRSSSFLIPLLILVVIVAALSIVIMQRRAPAAEPPAPTEPPAAETLSPAPAQTPAPAPTETLPPTEAPVFETRAPLETEEPAPEEPEEPRPLADASGALASATGTGLNISALWETFTDADGSAKLRVDVSVVSYSFFTSPLYQSVVLNVGGKTSSANSPEISYDGKDQITTPMASFVVDAPAPGTPISVTWHYRGSYSGKALDEITASGVIG